MQEDDVLIFDVDNARYVKDLDLPPFPEPAATVLMENLKSLLEKKEAFVNGINTTREKIVIRMLYNDYR